MFVGAAPDKSALFGHFQARFLVACPLL